ncbi:MAG: ABC transporter permease [Anaerolineae bacterium]|nr:ABC transporter permease [Anaerolineae bacterium]
MNPRPTPLEVSDTGENLQAREIGTMILILSGVLVFWEGFIALVQLPPYLLPPPSLIAKTMWTQRVYYTSSAVVTLGEALGGWGLGLFIGTLTAILITLKSHLERGVLVLAILIKATPMVAIAPLLIIWFGFGALPKIIVTGLMTFFPVLINVHAGLRAVDPAILALFHALNASKLEVLIHARWPSALPYLFAAMKVVGPLAIVGAVVAEWAGASAGLGRAMWLAYANLNMPALFAGIFYSAFLSISFYLGIIILERRIIFW